MQLTAEQRARFWRSIREHGEHWVWTGPVDRRTGAPMFFWITNGRRGHHHARRLVYLLTHTGRLGLRFVIAACDEPLCVRHVVPSASARRASPRIGPRWSTGRHPNHVRGQEVHTSRLTAADIPIIRGRAGTATARQVASEYNVTPPAIRKIWKRTSWAHVP